MGAAKVITNEVWESEVQSNPGLTVLDFSATWCGPCQQLAPHFDKLAEEYADRAVLGKVDVDEARTLAEKFNVLAVPTIVFVKGGQAVDQIQGPYPDKIRAKIEALL